MYRKLFLEPVLFIIVHNVWKSVYFRTGSVNLGVRNEQKIV